MSLYERIGMYCITGFLLVFAVVVLSVETIGLRNIVALQYEGPEVTAKGGYPLGSGPFVCAQFVKGSDHLCSTGEFAGDLLMVFIFSLFLVPSIVGAHLLPVFLSMILIPIAFSGLDLVAQKYSWKSWGRLRLALLIGTSVCLLIGFHLLFWNTLNSV